MLSGDSCAVNFEQAKSERPPFAKRGLAECRPFIKWAGGKRRLLDQYAALLPPTKKFRRYFEPFLGGGALFFHLRPKQALLADLNAELINCYKMVKEQPDDLIALLRKHKASEQYFYQLRDLAPATLSPLQRASRFIFLNKTCYNGLYRVNRNGQFNVPFGRYKKPIICDAEAIRSASRALRSVQLKVCSFENTISEARRGDFCYFDPPYAPLTATANFTSYTANNFTQQDQITLAAIARQLDKQGCLIMISNSDTELTRSLYRDFEITTVRCPRSINSNAFARGAINELVIKNY